MVNMSYCRFRNTARDLEDCMEHIDQMYYSRDENDEEEKEALEYIIQMAQTIVNKFGDADDE